MNLLDMAKRIDAIRANKTTNNYTTPEYKALEWKPVPGKDAKGNPSTSTTTVRILPNFHIGVEYLPFLPVQFYYEFGRVMLAPVQFDKADAIADFYQTLVTEYRNEKDKTRNKELYLSSKKFQPKERICVPVLVRGEEDKGVKFWWFSKQIFDDLIAIFENPDWGNICDLKNGHDIDVKYTPKELTANGYPKIDILPKPKVTPVTDDKEILTGIKSMPNIVELYFEPTYDETVEALEKYLKGNETAAKEEKPTSTREKRDDDFLNTISEPVKQLTDDLDKFFDED